MKILSIQADGTENFKLNNYDRAVIYVEGVEGGATFDVTCHGAVLGQVSQTEPLLITFGSGAPLKIVTSGGTGTNVTLHAYPVE